MSKFDDVQAELTKGGNYQHEILKLLCEIVEKLELQLPIPITEEQLNKIKNEVIIIPLDQNNNISKKRGRPKKK